MQQIDSMIATLDINSLSESLQTGSVQQRDYQWLAYKLTGDCIRSKKNPAYVTASVGAGKTIMIGAIARRFQDMGWAGMVLARQGEIADQDAAEAWNMGVKNSLLSASLGIKSTVYNVIIGTEKTVANELEKKLADFVPRYLLIDECHQLNWEDVISDKPETQYALIINKLKERCKEKYGKDLIIIGYTGSPFRNSEVIKGEFWKEEIVNISTDYLVYRGFLVPTVFGHPTNLYDLDQFKSSGIDGIKDFTDAQLSAMQKKISEQKSTTQKIMEEVVYLTKNRNGVLITCAGKKHCEEAAEFLPSGSYVIVTEGLGMKQRAQALKDAYDGKIKYVLQIGCLTTGVNIPYWDTSVILRKIMSLTLLTQLLGRGMRQLKDDQVKSGLIKSDHLVLDYTDTMEELGKLYFSPILEQAALSKAKRNNELIYCPSCNTENSKFARRCIGVSNDVRCEFFFSSRKCDPVYRGDKLINTGCGTLNDPCARYCRKCDNILIDPNEKLTNKHYKKDDFYYVKKFNIKTTRDNKGIIYEYLIEKEGKNKTVSEVFYPNSWRSNIKSLRQFNIKYIVPWAMRDKGMLLVTKNKIASDVWRAKGVIPHVTDSQSIRKILSQKKASSIIEYRHLITPPAQITHRLNSKNRDIITRKIFA